MSFLYFTQRLIEKKSIESEPESDLGFNYEDHEDFFVIEEPDRLSDAGLVPIDTLIETLNALMLKGANYVSCDWHCDHGDLDVYGYEFKAASQDEVNEHLVKLAELKLKEKEEKIRRLEQRISQLKSDSE
jgi:hypothetical protein